MKKKLLIILAVILVLLATILVYSSKVTSHHIKVIETSIIDDNLPEKYHGLKVVHFSDILYGKLTTIKDLEKVVTKINETNPDIVVFTGDLFHKDIKLNNKEINKVTSCLSKIKAKYGLFAIMGDNDTKYKDSYYQIFGSIGTILDNESALVYINDTTPIRITGINNPNKEETKTEEELKLYNILLLHKPDDIDKVKNKYNLVLAGHSMGGQIKLPFYGPLIKLKGAKNYFSGDYTANGMKLFVTDGIGTQNINMRINNNPKINFYRIYQK